MSALKTKGQRFMVSPSGRDANWVHPAEVASRYPGWTDCTDMDDAQFNHFMAERRAANPPLAA